MDTVLFNMPGSQFGSKALAAIDHAKIPYKVVFANMLKLTQELEPPHTVPQLRYKGELIVDSADILKKLDADLPNVTFYHEAQKAEIEELEKWCGDYFNGYIHYFCWADEEGFALSMEKTVISTLKLTWMPHCLSSRVIGCAGITAQRGAYRSKARKIFGDEKIIAGRNRRPDEGEVMRKSLIEDAEKLEARFKEDAQEWICATPSPSAADFTLYGLIERLVGDTGDCEIQAATPWLWEKAKSSRLKAWHLRMRQKYPLKCYGKYKEVKVWSDQ